LPNEYIGIIGIKKNTALKTLKIEKYCATLYAEK